MTLHKILHLVREVAHADPYAETFMYDHPRIRGAVSDGIRRGLLRSRRPMAPGVREPRAVRLTDAGIRWCRENPKMKRRVRVWRNR